MKTLFHFTLFGCLLQLIVANELWYQTTGNIRKYSLFNVSRLANSDMPGAVVIEVVILYANFSVGFVKREYPLTR